MRPARPAAAPRGGGLLLPKIAFCASLVAAGFAYGYLSHRNKLPPQELITTAKKGWDDLMQGTGEERPWYFIPTTRTETVVARDAAAVAPGLTLYAGIGKDASLFARIVDVDGSVAQAWTLDWFEIWPDSTHLDDDDVPKSPPGTFIHGMELMEDGGLVFNFEGLGMVRVDAAGEVVWRLPYRTHHSLMRDDEGNFWSPGMKRHKEGLPGYPLYNPPFTEFTIVKVSPDGELLLEKSVFDLLRDNDQLGLLYLAARDGMKPEMTGDTLHLNDVKVFSSTMTPGFLAAGDVMISLRNLNAVLVFSQAGWKLKHLSIGKVIRQHDPDFIDGNTLSIFDNHQLGDREDGMQSRIVLESLPDGAITEVFRGAAEAQFYTGIMGKHQTLPNGNLLLVEAQAGRIWEVDTSGRLVWELNNIVEDGMLGALSDAIRLPPSLTAERLAELRAACEAGKGSAAVASSAK